MILSLEKGGVAVLQMHQLKKEAEKESPQFFCKGIWNWVQTWEEKNLEEACFICCLSKVRIKFKA